jgi:hypothetical protein
MARAETNNDLYRGWEAVYKSEFETDILEVFMKSIEHPEELTQLEMMRVSSYLGTILTLYQRQSSMFYNFGLTYDPSNDLVYAADMYLGSRFARSWFLANRGWLEIEPKMYEILSRELEANPVQSKWVYMERLRSGM